MQNTPDDFDHRGVALAWARYTIPEDRPVPPELLDEAERVSAGLSRVEDGLVSMGIVGAAGAGELVVAHFGELFFREMVLPDLRAMVGEVAEHPFDRGWQHVTINGVAFRWRVGPEHETVAVRPSRAATPITPRAKE